MASAPPPTEMEQEATCPICQEWLTDPVVLDCGHSFCQGCITDYCDKWEGLGSLKCPVCQVKFQRGDFRRNWQLANLLEKMKLLPQSPREEDLCLTHNKKLHLFCKEDEKLLCFDCERSPEHQGHTVLRLEEAAQQHKAVVAAGKGRVCQKHEEPLKLFCKDDEALICWVCDRSKEHRDHETLPLEEASQEYKDQFCSFLEVLKKEREKIVAYKGETEKESQDLLKQVNGEKQETVAKFRQMHTFLEEQETLLLAQMEEVEKEVTRYRDRHLARLSEELSSLESLIREMEEKCQQPAGDLLQDARNTLQRYEERESFENPVAFPLALKWDIWEFSDLNPLLEAMKKQLKDTLDSGLHLQKANVTLDPDTAHPQLILPEGQKRVRRGEKAQALPDNPERFDWYKAVLGREGFRAGRHFWEVLVGSEEAWYVGVARKSVRRKGIFAFSPEGGFWAVGKLAGTFRAHITNRYPPLTVRGELKRIRVCLNCAGGRVAFFDADTAALLYEFSGASFSGETLLPLFYVYGKGHLTISS